MKPVSTHDPLHSGERDPAAAPRGDLRAAPGLEALRIDRGARARRQPWGRWAAAVLLVALAAAGAWLWKGRPLGALAVETTTAAVITEGQALTLLSAAGYVEAETRADISPKITSRITELHVTEGSRVRKGEVIARLDHTDLDAQLAEAVAAHANAEADLARQRALHAERLVPSSVLDAAVAIEASMRARVGYVRALLDYTVLRAPFDGVVVARRAHVGEAVSPYGAPGQGSASGGAIVTLVDFSSLYVGADVNEANLARLSERQPAEIVLDAYPARVYHGVLRQVVPAADRQKGTVKVKVAFLDPDERILPDLSARVNFTRESTLGREASRLVEVPRSALVTRGGRTGVFLVVGERAVFRAVTPGRESDTGVEVREGLAGGETLVADAERLDLADGARVRAGD